MASFEIVPYEPPLFRNCQIKRKDLALYESFSKRMVMAVDCLITRVKNDQEFSHLSFEHWEMRRYLPCLNKETRELFDIYQFSLSVKDFPERKREVYIVLSVLPGKEQVTILKGISRPIVFTSLDYKWLNNPSYWFFWDK